MVRKLKLHEKKLLKKTDFIQWEVDQQGKQTEQMRKYNITKREHYSLYNKLAAEVSAACFARRRLPVVMKKIGMVDSIRQASDFVEQGHVRIGPKLVTDPAFMVTRNQEDAITWTNASKIKQHVLDYNNARDDFDLA
ncbi:S4 domain protein [Teladorsagia circumcincta]|uniref:U3 small nucleolar ribonucleoprotein protein IMP3 n=1 Tax=Teladorsagia circumcincta TaxID=45464 RepID=A0A2G9U011_TELCI|nr:S4 domain protein [Teladorsagia circumcincta]